jgi:hypothetical protein
MNNRVKIANATKVATIALQKYETTICMFCGKLVNKDGYTKFLSYRDDIEQWKILGVSCIECNNEKYYIPGPELEIE